MSDEQTNEPQPTPRPNRDNHSYPWTHGKATRVNGTIDGAEARLSVRLAAKLTGLDDTVVKVPQTTAANPLGIVLPNPEQWMTVSTREVEVEGKKGLVSSYQGSVGSRYEVVQNVEAFEFFDAALGPNAACIEGAGRMGVHGARVFMMAAMPEMLEIIPGDPVERYIMLTNTHDGSGNIEAMFVNWRVLSNSGVQHTTKNQGRVRIRHTKNAKAHVKQANTVLAKNQQYWDRATRIYRYMAKRDVSVQRAQEFVANLFPDIVDYDNEGNEIERRTSPQALRAREAITTLFEGGCPGSSVAGKTDWGLYNCVAYFVEHARENRSKRNGAWEVSTFGPGADLRTRAFNWLSKDAGNP